MLLSDPQIHPEDPEKQPVTYQVPDTYIHLFSTIAGARYSCRGTKESPHDPQYRLLLTYDEREINTAERLDYLEYMANRDYDEDEEDDLTGHQDDLLPESDFVTIQCPLCKFMYMLSLETYSMDIERL
ncbi:MAG: hypothetical protein U1A25_01680 [Candidatus Sungbacteria bacterium]|nr:hypothetical protein [bacterium]MDZ4260351.1 hypothetical protein [Candidatus Sungbacteria bacterium]